MATIIQEVTGDICEPCCAYSVGIADDYWGEDPEEYERVNKHAFEWAELGYMALDIGDDPEARFGHSCIVCGIPPYAGTVYAGTLTLFARN